MKYVLMVFVFLLTISTYGQRTYGIKVYQNTDIFNAQYNGFGNFESSEINHVNLGRFSIALSIMTKGKISHEVEVFIPEIDKHTEDVLFPKDYEFRANVPYSTNTISTYSIRYEFIRTISDQSKRLVASVAAGLNPYFIINERTPLTADVYPFEAKFYGVAVNFTPRLSCKLSDKFSLDLNVPLKVYTLEWVKTEIRNPQIPIRQQESDETVHTFFEKAFTIRLGVAYHF